MRIYYHFLSSGCCFSRHPSDGRANVHLQTVASFKEKLKEARAAVAAATASSSVQRPSLDDAYQVHLFRLFRLSTQPGRCVPGSSLEASVGLAGSFALEASRQTANHRPLPPLTLAQQLFVQATLMAERNAKLSRQLEAIGAELARERTDRVGFERLAKQTSAERARSTLLALFLRPSSPSFLTAHYCTIRGKY